MMVADQTKNTRYKSTGYSAIRTVLAFFCGFFICFVPVIIYVANEIEKTLPDVANLFHHRPAQPLRIYAASEELLAEYGEERREIVSIREFPRALKNAIISIEDAKFYHHRGVDYSGVFRAVVRNIASQENSQGASTITMQVARNMFLSKEKSYIRKIAEIMLAFKIEALFSKDQILEIYVNEIFLGERSYGFAAAASTYFNKSLSELSISESAVLAGLPKAPSAFNPVANYQRAMIRKNYILERMRELNYLNQEEFLQAISEEVKITKRANTRDSSVQFAVEEARKMIYEHYGESTYKEGFDVELTIDTRLQKAAHKELRDGLMRLQKIRGWEGVEGRFNVEEKVLDKKNIEKFLINFPDSGVLKAAVITEVLSNGIVKAMFRNGEVITLFSESGAYSVLELTKSSISRKRRIEKGTVVRVKQHAQNKWVLSQKPHMEGAMIAMDMQSGNILAMTGGFDFSLNNFNHVTQAQRQTGSTFKPFVYGAAIEKGFFPGFIVDDTRRVVKPAQRGSASWAPRNYANNYEGDITIRRAFIRSKNVATVNVMEAAGEDYVRNKALSFGFIPDFHPPGLPLALGAGLTSPMHLTQAFSVFGNNGAMVSPILIKSIRQRNGDLLYKAPDVSVRHQVISERNAFIVDSLLRDVVRSGTARQAIRLGREDVAGKTGTSNRSKDLWFSGYAGGIAATTWIGYDDPKSLGAVTGGTIALPVWIKFMEQALSGRPEIQVTVPPEVSLIGGDYIYTEFLEKRICSNSMSNYVRSPYSCDIK